MKNLFIKINKESTSFILTEEKNVMLWESVDIGENNIIDDLSNHLSLKFNDSKNLAKELVLKQNISFKDEEKSKEIIVKRLVEIFERIKDVLEEKHLLKEVSKCFITIENTFFIGTEEVIKDLLGIETKMLDLKNIEVFNNTMSLGERTRMIFREFFN
jgi:cell division ATPase FtsA